MCSSRGARAATLRIARRGEARARHRGGHLLHPEQGAGDHATLGAHVLRPESGAASVVPIRGCGVADDQRDLPALAEEAELSELPMVAQLLALSTPEHRTMSLSAWQGRLCGGIDRS